LGESLPQTKKGCGDAVIPGDLDKRAFAQKAKAVYNSKHRKRPEPVEKGKVVALEVESGEIFLGHTAMEAWMKARQKFPECWTRGAK